MHWSLILLIVIFVLCIGALAFVMFTYRSKGNVDKPSFDEIRMGHSQSRGLPSLDIPTNLTEYERRMNNMSIDDLQQELARMISGLDVVASEEPVSPEDQERAEQLLQSVTQNTNRTDADMFDGAEGDGIVMCAGGFQYGTDAYIALKLLREQGCELPIELFHRNDEMSAEMKELFESLGNLEVRNIDQIASISIPSRFAIKPLSIYHSKRKRVLLLDADNMTVKDPTGLFKLLDDEDVSAVFWPDYWHIERDAACWKALSESQRERVTYAFSQESGQVLVDRSRSMRALSLCCKINVMLHSQLKRLFPKPFNEGDKDTWHFSWLATDTPYQMISSRAGGAGARDVNGQYIGNTIVQYDDVGEPAFLHKCWAKWAEQTQRPQWTDSVQFVVKNRGRVNHWTHGFEDGPVYTNPFAETFGDLEDTCWKHLSELRNMDWYASQFSSELQDL